MYSVHQIYTRFTVLAYECLPVRNKGSYKVIPDIQVTVDEA